MKTLFSFTSRTKTKAAGGLLAACLLFVFNKRRRSEGQSGAETLGFSGRFACGKRKAGKVQKSSCYIVRFRSPACRPFSFLIGEGKGNPAAGGRVFFFGVYKMNCLLYECLDNAKKLNKTLANGTPKEIIFLNKQNLMYVIMRVSGLNENQNYCKLTIGGKDRYYFIDNRVILNNGLFELSLKQDVLMTFKNEILAANGLLIESDGTKNADKVDYINSKVESVLQYDYINRFTSKSDVLVTAYGGY